MCCKTCEIRKNIKDKNCKPTYIIFKIVCYEELCKWQLAKFGRYE